MRETGRAVSTTRHVEVLPGIAATESHALCPRVVNPEPPGRFARGATSTLGCNGPHTSGNPPMYAAWQGESVAQRSGGSQASRRLAAAVCCLSRLPGLLRRKRRTDSRLPGAALGRIGGFPDVLSLPGCFVLSKADARLAGTQPHARQYPTGGDQTEKSAPVRVRTALAAFTPSNAAT
jgi:hypothetical protein